MAAAKDHGGGDLAAQLDGVRAELEAIRDLEAITQLKARYCRLVDTHEWRRWVDECLADDVVLDIQGRVFEGREAALAMITRSIGDDGSTVHHVYTPELELTGPDTATGVWAMEDWVRLQGERPRSFHGCGHYHETYRRTPEGWRIATSVLSRLRVDPL